MMGAPVDPETPDEPAEIKSLRARVRFLESAAEATGAGVWEWWPQTGAMRINARWATMLGHDPAELEPLADTVFLRLLHPDDLGPTRELMRRYAEAEIDSHEIDIRMRHKDGHWVWLNDRGKVAERDVENRPVRIAGMHVDVSEERKLQELLRESHERLRIIADYTLDSEYWIGPEGNLLYQSPSIEKITGHAAGEFLADPCLFRGLVHPEDRAQFDGIFPAKPLPGPARSCTFRIRAKDGTLRWLENESRPIFDPDGGYKGIRGSSRDITARREAELALRKSESSLSAILDNSRDAISLNRDRKHLYGNKAFLELFGIPSAEDVVGTRTIELIAPALREEVQARFAGLREGGKEPVCLETRGLRRDGTEFDLEVTASAYGEEGSPVIISVLRDVTQRKRAEAEIRGLLREKEILLREVHHRIKNNMATLCSILSLESAQAEAPEAREALAKAGSRLESMMVLYDRLYRSTDSGEVGAAEYLPDLVAQIVGSCGGAEAVVVETLVDPVKVDTRRMATISIALNELITNAMKYAVRPRGGGRISVTLRSAGERLLLAVEDDGPGMPATALPEAGLPSPRHGFGLMLVSSLAGQLCGEFCMVSPAKEQAGPAGGQPSPGPGTRMSIEFPLKA